MIITFFAVILTISYLTYFFIYLSKYSWFKIEHKYILYIYIIFISSFFSFCLQSTNKIFDYYIINQAVW